MSQGASIEHLKHRLRIREILLDKLVLAILLAAVALYGNMRLSQYENRLNGELEHLKSVYNLQRILDKREIDAHENAWVAISDFSVFVQSNMDAVWSEEFQGKFTIKILNAERDVMIERAYLADEVAAEIDTFFDAHVAELVDKWSGESGRGTLPFPTFQEFLDRVNQLGQLIAKTIRAERDREDAINEKCAQ